MSRASRFFEELKRRHVVRVAIVYMVVAWFLMQIGEVVFPALSLPDWTLTFVVVLAVFGFPIAVVLAWAFDLTPEGVVRADATGAVATVPPPSIPPPAGEDEEVELTGRDLSGIVVLPFENMSPDAENEYFSDGIAEDLISRLCETSSLRVISRTSAWMYKNARVGAKQIAAELGVAYLVEGSVRRSGNNVRIVAQLIDARSDGHVWAETYDRELEDIFAIQSDVAHRIAAALQITLTGGGSASGADASPTTDLKTYDLFLRGRYHWNRRTATDLESSVTHFRAAIERDPDFVPARAALAESYVTLAIYGLRPAADVLPLACAEAEEALQRKPGQPSALSALACVRAIYDWEWDQASTAFEQAIRDSPQYPTAPHWYATNVLIPLGRFDEAIEQLKRAAEVDPISPSIEASFGVVEFMRGDYASAVTRFERLLTQDDGLAFAHYCMGLSAHYMGESEQAIEALERASSTGGWSAEVQAALGGALATAGRESEAREVLRGMIEGKDDHYVSPVRIAQLHAGLSEPEAALDLLEEALSTRAADLIWVDVFPAFRDVRALPRYEEIRRPVFGVQ